VNLHVTINEEPKEFICQPTDTLLDILRREGYSGVKVCSVCREAGKVEEPVFCPRCSRGE